ncbi:hypothetical protein ACHAWC_006389 [Mediolabrus comicus]
MMMAGEEQLEHSNLTADNGEASRNTFIPEKVNFRRRGVRRGEKSDGQSSSGDDIHSSVVFAESSITEDDVSKFNEVDDLCPHDRYEGGDIVNEPKSSMTSSGSHSSYYGDSSFKASYRALTSSLMQSKRSTRETQNIMASLSSQVPTNDSGTADDSSKRSSIVGGKEIADMSFEERRQIFAPERSRDSLLINDESDKEGLTQGLDESITSKTSDYAPIITGEGENTTDGMVSSVDWSSLTKSCKRAKETMRDAASSHAVVKNMFLSHQQALITVLTLYVRRYTDGRGRDNHNRSVAMEEVLTRTIETKRALKFAISCLAPSRNNTDLYDESAKKMRQDLQVAATEGKYCPGVEVGEDEVIRQYNGLHVSLAELIVSNPMSYEHMTGIPDGEKHPKIISSMEKNQLSVRTQAARLLCNLVTDNPAAATRVLRDIPFSPTEAQLEARMTVQVLASYDNRVGSDSSIHWSDLIHAVSQTQTIKQQACNTVERDEDSSQDREVLAAVVAALHNLLASMEMRDSVMEVESEMKRIEKLKQLRKARNKNIIEEEDDENDEEESASDKPIDALFEAASSPALINALLRSTLPATAILKMLQPVSTTTMDSSRPKFVPPTVDSSPEVEDSSDSATEWISFVLERIVSRGLLLQVLHSAGGKGDSTTPEQVVLVSCIRQAIDAYQTSLPQHAESGEFDMRRLTITAKSTNKKCPHPLWGRGDGLRTAVPVLHSLANELEKIRERAIILQSSCGRTHFKEEYEGELNCTNHIIHDIRDILAQCLSKNTSQAFTDQHMLAEARSVLGRETTLIASCCEDLARIVDITLEKHSGKSGRELNISSHDQETAINTVRLIGNLVYHTEYNQNLLRTTLVLPMATTGKDDGETPSRTGLHVLLSATSLGPACFTLREWCIVAIRNAVENNEANIELVRRLEANEALGDTPELRKLGVKVDLDERGNVRVQKRDS